jgi:hypothetical protein
MAGLWNDLTEVLSEKPLRRTLLGADTPADTYSVTLFQAVRFAVGVQSPDLDSADVAFWEWQIMRTQLSQVWEALDTAATKLSGRREQASIWIHRPEQVGLDILEFVKEASTYAPKLPSLKVNRRPSGFLMVNIGKIDSAIVSTAAVLVNQSMLPYGEILDSLLKRGGTDEELLVFLDTEVERVGADRKACNQSPIPREIVRAKQKVRDQMALASMPMTAFLEILNSSNNLTNISDDALLGRLLQIAPEENKVIAKKVELARSVAE